MPKPNAQVLLMQARKEIALLKQEIWVSKGFTIQQCQDMAMIALNREFQFGPKYNERFEKAFREAFVDYSELCLDDGKDDEDIIYTKDVVDRALRVARGDILPFDERYAIERLYFRDRRQEWKEGADHEN